MADAAAPARRRWLILAVIATAYAMVVLSVTIMNIALPSAQKSLRFSTIDTQWVITAYALAFGSLLLLGGRLADLAGQKLIFLAGLTGFAAASAVGGAAASFDMLVAARACQGAFGALLAPASLSLLTTTFTDPGERGRAFGVYGAVAGAGGGLGLLLGGLLTEYLSWRWCLYVDLVFAAAAGAGAARLLTWERSPRRFTLDIPGVLTVSSAIFCIVYGFSNVASHGWRTPSTWGFLAAGGVLLALFGWRQTRAAQPLLPPRVVLDRTRGGAYLSVLIAGGGMFGIFLILSFYLQQTLAYSPVLTGLAFLPLSGMLVICSNVSTVLVMPRLGPRPPITLGMLAAAGGMVWLTGAGIHASYPAAILGPLMLLGAGLGLVIAPAFNAGTFGAAPPDQGVVSATVNTSQQLGGSIGIALLTAAATTATASYVIGHESPITLVHGRPGGQLLELARMHGYTTAFWWSAVIFGCGAVAAGALLRWGPLGGQRPGAARHATVRETPASTR